MNALKVIESYIETAKSKVNTIPEDRRDLYLALLDNQKKGFVEIAEQTSTANIDRVARVFIPVVKKLVGQSIIKDIVGFQPIPDRISAVRYMEIVYSNGANAGKPAFNPAEMPTDYSLDAGEGQPIQNELEIVFREKEVKARARKLAGRWTFEAQDSASKIGFDIEKEITKAIATYITREISNEIILDLLNGANGASATWQKPAPSDSPQVRKGKIEELMATMVRVGAEIQNKTLIFPNWVIVSPLTAAMLEETAMFIYDTDGGLQGMVDRLYYSGTLKSRFKVYVVNGFPNNKVLVGYKGGSEIETGYIYAPYIPLISVDKFFNVENWTWVKSVGSFYAKAFVRPDLYGIIDIVD